MVENRGFVDKMKSSARRMVVFYGSQTGTAEEFAGRLAKEGARYGCKARNQRKWLSLGVVLTTGWSVRLITSLC